MSSFCPSARSTGKVRVTSALRELKTVTALMRCLDASSSINIVCKMVERDTNNSSLYMQPSTFRHCHDASRPHDSRSDPCAIRSDEVTRRLVYDENAEINSCMRNLKRSIDQVVE